MSTVHRKRGGRQRREDPETLSEKIRAKGLRLTGQRRLIADVLDGANDHLDAEAVCRLARRQDPTIHRSTVYRTLDTLKRHGLIDELDLMHVDGERHYYEVRPSKLHVHLVCTECKGVEEPGGPFWEGLGRRAFAECGFEAETIRLEMAGTCASCRQRASIAARRRRL